MVFRELSENQMHKSSANRARSVFDGITSEISLKKILKSVGDRELPCGTEVLILWLGDDRPFQVTLNERLVRKS